MKKSSSKNQLDLLRRVPLIYIIAAEAIKFFNKKLPGEKRKDGLRVCVTDRDSGIDLLNIPVGSLSVEDSKKFSELSIVKANFTSGNENFLTSFGNSTDVPQGGVKGFRFCIGIAGQELQIDEVVAAAILCILEKTIGCDFLLEAEREDYLYELKNEFDQPGRNDKFNEFMSYLTHDKKIFENIEFFEFMK